MVKYIQHSFQAITLICLFSLTASALKTGSFTIQSITDEKIQNAANPDYLIRTLNESLTVHHQIDQISRMNMGLNIEKNRINEEGEEVLFLLDKVNLLSLFGEDEDTEKIPYEKLLNFSILQKKASFLPAGLALYEIEKPISSKNRDVLNYYRVLSFDKQNKEALKFVKTMESQIKHIDILKKTTFKQMFYHVFSQLNTPQNKYPQTYCLAQAFAQKTEHLFDHEEIKKILKNDLPIISVVHPFAAGVVWGELLRVVNRNAPKTNRLRFHNTTTETSYTKGSATLYHGHKKYKTFNKTKLPKKSLIKLKSRSLAMPLGFDSLLSQGELDQDETTTLFAMLASGMPWLASKKPLTQAEHILTLLEPAKKYLQQPLLFKALEAFNAEQSYERNIKHRVLCMILQREWVTDRVFVLALNNYLSEAMSLSEKDQIYIKDLQSNLNEQRTYLHETKELLADPNMANEKEQLLKFQEEIQQKITDIRLKASSIRFNQMQPATTIDFIGLLIFYGENALTPNVTFGLKKTLDNFATSNSSACSDDDKNNATELLGFFGQ